MSLVVPIFLLIIGLVVLIIAGDVMVRGAAAIARHWGVPSLIVGLTIVAFGTSAPELVVGVQAALSGSGALASGNVVGSNIANILLALGLPALIMAIPTNMSGVTRNALVALFATVLFIILSYLGNPLARWQGAILFAGIVIYLGWMYRLSKMGIDDPILEDMTDIDEGEDGLPAKSWVSISYVIGGIIGLIIGGDLIVKNAVIIAESIGISETIIGLTIVAIGTSLPEIATVVVASYRGHSEVAIGNVLGSNIFNIFAVMGASALAGPIAIDGEMFKFDFWVMLAAIIMLIGFVMQRKPIGKRMGAIFVGSYVIYMIILANIFA